MVTFHPHFITLFVTLGQYANAWSPLPATQFPQSLPRSFTSYSNHLHSSEPKNKIEDGEPDKGKKDDIEWGVSYIGGDPCGSKYNDDPFDSKPSKPGFPNDMKARIETLAAQKKKDDE